MTDMSERSTATAVEGFSGGAERGTAAADRLDLDVMIVGAQKSGTSTLLRHLLCAPGVAPLHRPEIAYLTDDDEYERGGRVAVRKYFGSEAPPNALRVGKTAGMMTSPTAVRRLVSDSPRVRLVAVLRNPVHRAYSAYWFAKRRGFEPAESFSEAIDRELSGKSLQLPRQDLREYVLCGEYAVHLEQLHHEVDPRRVHVYLLEDLHADTRRIADEILEPFGVAIPPSALPPERVNTSARARSERLARLTASSSRLRRMLRPVLSPAIRGRIIRAMVSYNEVPFRPPRWRTTSARSWLRISSRTTAGSNP